MITYFCKPKLKVGTEWVQKGSSCTGAASSVSGIARAIYERTFRLMVEKCNETLVDPTMKKAQYIGVLDIAGFEIFDFNTVCSFCVRDKITTSSITKIPMLSHSLAAQWWRCVWY